MFPLQKDKTSTPESQAKWFNLVAAYSPLLHKLFLVFIEGRTNYKILAVRCKHSKHGYEKEKN